MSRRVRSGTIVLGRYGPGNDGNRPERGRWMQVWNQRNYDAFFGERTANERYSIYNQSGNIGALYAQGAPQGLYANIFNQGVYGVTSNRRIYQNRSQIGNGPCWNWNSNAANYRTPPGCRSGTTYEGRTNQNNVNPNNQSGRTGVHHGDGQWMFYFEKDYGCNSNSFMKLSVNRCYLSYPRANLTGYV